MRNSWSVMAKVYAFLTLQLLAAVGLVPSFCDFWHFDLVQNPTRHSHCRHDPHSRHSLRWYVRTYASVSSFSSFSSFMAGFNCALCFDWSTLALDWPQCWSSCFVSAITKPFSTSGSSQLSLSLLHFKQCLRSEKSILYSLLVSAHHIVCCLLTLLFFHILIEGQICSVYK